MYVEIFLLNLVEIRTGRRFFVKKKQKGWISIWIIVAILVSVVFPASNSLADSQQQRKRFYEGEGFQVQFDMTEAWDGGAAAGNE